MEKEINTISEDIKSKELEVWEMQKAMLDEEEKIELRIAELRKEVDEDKDVVTGKNIYTNEKTRDAATKLKIGQDEELKKKFAENKNKKDSIKKSEIQIDFLKRKFRILLALLERNEEK